MSNDYGRGGPYPNDNTQRINPQPEQPGYWQPPTYAEAPQPYSAPPPMPANLTPVPYVQPKPDYGTPVQQYPGPMVHPSYQPNMAPTNMAPVSIGHDPNDVLRREAEKRVKDREGFQQHFRTYLFVIGLQIAIWTIISITSGRAIYFWPIWPAFGWGIFVFFHYTAVYNNSRPDAVQRERQIQAEMQRLAGRSGYYPPATPGQPTSSEQQAQQEWQQRYEAAQRQQGSQDNRR